MSYEGLQLGHYKLLRQIGSGGMGEIYLAEDMRMQRQVAMKVVRSEALPFAAEQADELERLFLREMQVISRLDHPHILPVFDFGKEELNGSTLTYMVMPYRPEGSLIDWLRRRRQVTPLAPQEVGRMILQAAEALQYSHDKQIIHQDIKLSNFLIRSRSGHEDEPDLVLTDFGVARFTTTMNSATQHVRGTPAFMAPEQWEGRPVPASDQYSLAVMAYQLLTGRLPFQGTPAQIMHHHFMETPQPPSSFNSAISSDTDAVILRALAKRPEERYPSILEFGEALQQILQIDQDTLPVPAVPTPVEAPISWGGTNGAFQPLNSVPLPQPAGAAPALMVLPSLPTTAPDVAPITPPEAAAEAEPHVAMQSRNQRSPRLTVKLQEFTGRLQEAVNGQENPRLRAGLLLLVVLLIVLASSGFLFYNALAGRGEPDHPVTQNGVSTQSIIGARATATSLAATAGAQARATANAQLGTRMQQAQATAVAATATALANPYPPADATLLYTDPLTKQNLWKPASDTTFGGACSFTKSTFQVTETTANHYYPCNAGIPALKNFVFEVQMTIQKGDCGGMTLRFAGSDRFYFLVCSSGSYSLYHYTASGRKLLASGTSTAIVKGAKQQNLIAAEANGSQIQLFANKQRLKTATYTPVISGQPGLVAANLKSSGTTVTYRNATIWQLP